MASSSGSSPSSLSAFKNATAELTSTAKATTTRATGTENNSHYDNNDNDDQDDEEHDFLLLNTILDRDEYCEVVDEHGTVAYEAFCEDEETDATKQAEVDNNKKNRNNPFFTINSKQQQQQPQQQQQQQKHENSRSFRWIRIEKKSDDCFAPIATPDDVWKQINHVKALQQQQANGQRTDLYTRRWEPFPGSRLVSTPRKHSITVLQFNTLAEGLSAGPEVIPPFSMEERNNNNQLGNKHKHHRAGYCQREKNEYGGFSDLPHPHISLNFALRRWRLLEVLLGGGIQDPNNGGTRSLPVFDLIALEEVDRYRGFFAPALRLFGYDGLFLPKSRAPGVRMGWYSDGCALFWKRQLFELQSQERAEYSIGNQVYLIAVLRHIPSQRSMVVAVTHLKAQSSEQNERVRCAQVEELLSHVERTAQSVARNEKLKRGTADVPVLILGDFNADPPSVLRPTMALSSSAIERVLRPPQQQHQQQHRQQQQQQQQRRSYHSCYPVDPSPRWFYTTWKTRGAKTTKRIIDYIFFHAGGQSWTCTATLQIPSEKDLEPTKLPGLRYPSDHLAIAAKFEWDVDTNTTTAT